MIVAVLRARTVNDSEGIATPVQSLYDAFSTIAKQANNGWRSSDCADIQQVQCPGGTCPTPTPYLLPYRYREQFRNQQSTPTPTQPLAPAWPTLPISSGSTIDLGPTNEKLDKIADLLIKQFQSPPPPPVAQPAAQVPLPAPVDDAARKAAEEARNTATEAKAQSDKIADKLGKIDSVLEKFGGDP